jgi:hypothetical protein
MVIKSLYKDYFQKSRVFLYPALGIKRGGSVTPIETYVSWLDHYTKEDGKLICLYHLRSDPEFRQFEKLRLSGNRLFHDFKQVDENKGVYVFDFGGSLKHDWDCFIRGKYSKMTAEHKKTIKDYIGRNSGELPYVESFLHPEKYFKLYAEIMNVHEQMLRDVGELCTVPDMKSETLEISVINLELTQKIS